MRVLSHTPATATKFMLFDHPTDVSINDDSDVVETVSSEANESWKQYCVIYTKIASIMVKWPEYQKSVSHDPVTKKILPTLSSLKKIWENDLLFL